ncbi:uncharacterized protein [Centruroides vittatus]|uniref:uncharacterized protein n=1 Tax=Centruroides vittatus TaxID=120091 RepID=UPI00350F4D96
MENDYLKKREDLHVLDNGSINTSVEIKDKNNLKFSNENSCSFDKTLEVHIPSPDDAALPHNANQDGLTKKTINVPKNEEKIITSKGKLKQQRLMPKTNPGTKMRISNSKKTNPEPKNKTITDYFPVRRSDRRTLVTIKVGLFRARRKDENDLCLLTMYTV